MGFELRDRFETTDGSRPQSTGLCDELAHSLPLSAFSVLSGGDAFDGGKLPPETAPLARTWAAEKLTFEATIGEAERERTMSEAARLLSGNPVLVARMGAAKPIAVDIVPEGDSLVARGYPECINERASGLFWDHPAWSRARIALRLEHLFSDELLVVHEVAHAVHALALTGSERVLIDRVLRRTFVDRASIDEAFAIYAEREMCKDFSLLEKRAPGIYGFVRRQWDENQLFVRFARKLWRPHVPLAGPKMASASAWRKFSGH